MCIRQILHMHIIAYAGPVAGWIVLTKHRQGISFAFNGVQNERDQMRLRPVMLPNLCLFIRTRHIEIPERQMANTEGHAVIMEHVLDRSF